ncbi:hypothetical protein [Natronobacterium gregoryi]|uniref:Uncharacterized protein n=2 Tax=Natronobacterium gregoryi TaxID=44930 RepID=L0ADP2_NATGS|nr:hypothetical protein [Natronobacterium gregoryi]AFZ71549.1 hypothetical protein Natgr_0291 [Natronobacterium gregoryi SP2]ELY66606.1 hypothetical protein C490_12577 [Natronobacterium gregoryi SP2]PLK21318.1 hypothetical protein CYV19_04590 [Natronobacterium gregoryi SP2]SFI82155.1 hypothetical protein SAMN05443661_10693 [Natronobacterium gregoryi]
MSNDDHQSTEEETSSRTERVKNALYLGALIAIGVAFVSYGIPDSILPVFGFREFAVVFAIAVVLEYVGPEFYETKIKRRLRD